MAIPWFTVLAAVPWKQVIENAPKVADGAMKLWNSVAGKAPPGKMPPPPAEPGLKGESRVLALMDGRIDAIEAKTSDLHAQMLASSELIKTLAEQNAQLVQRIEANRLRVLWLTAATVGASVIALAALVLAVG